MWVCMRRVGTPLTVVLNELKPERGPGNCPLLQWFLGIVEVVA